MRLHGAKLSVLLHHHRNFIAARVKWVRDPYLDTAVSKEKDLQQAISLKNQIASSPFKSLPLSSLSLLKPQFNLPSTAQKFFDKYHTFFTRFQPSPSLPVHVKLTPLALLVHKEEQEIHNSPTHRDDAVKRLAKLLMLTKSTRLPLHIVDRFKFDLGLPHNYITSLLSDYPEYFNVCQALDCSSDNKETLHLELLSWRDEFAMSEMEMRAAFMDIKNVKKGERIAFSLSYPNGFDLRKRVKDWVFEWQGLPYTSPYENAFHFNPNGDQAEKWIVALLHELLWLLVSKKTEKENVLILGDYLGIRDRFKKALVHHPGIFYVSNKIRTQTVVLREAYRKDVLVPKHPLVGMRFRYIHLLNKANEPWRKSTAGTLGSWSKRQVASSINRKQRRIVMDKNREGEEQQSNDSSDSEFDEYMDYSEIDSDKDANNDEEAIKSEL
ncbi:protein WHAT'S THIS FACTOR 9, mitochondrial [Euphorbia lathyris]|uniref:protein WHAT'S THIS FACTOR 9, mitochondrial n=1 Tax=Euphorbia lathyris TaxID=212925 RepID=UPI0033133DCA